MIADVVLLMGIIPAYAGSTAPVRMVLPRKTDHPGIRGEHGLSRVVQNRHYGSSPHTRGALGAAGAAAGVSGIIPAYAGSTRFSVPRHERPRDHPRIRGEHDNRAA